MTAVWADVCLERTMCSAVILRILENGITCSRSPGRAATTGGAAGATGAGAGGAGVGEATAGAGVAAGADPVRVTSM